MYGTSSKLSVKTPEQHQLGRYTVFTVKFE